MLRPMRLLRHSSRVPGSPSLAAVPRPFLVLIFAAFCLTLCPRAAAQQTPDLSQATLEELMNIKVVSASKHLQSAETAPSLVTVVTAYQIKKHGYRTVADILSSVGGFYITYDRLYSSVRMRGFGLPDDSNVRILVLLDGHRLNDPVRNGAYIGTDFLLDIDLIDRVEVIRGPSSSLYGTNAFLGVVNIISKHGAQLNGVELSSEAGSFDSYKARICYGKQFSAFEVLLSGSYYTSRGENLFFPQFNNPLDNFGVAEHADDDGFRSLFGEFAIHKLVMRAGYVYREKGDPTASHLTVFNDSRNRSFNLNRTLDLQYQNTFGADWDLMLRTYHDSSRFDTFYMWRQSPTAETNLSYDNARGAWWGGEMKLIHTFFGNHRITGGLEWRDNLREDQVNYDIAPNVVCNNDRRSSWLAALYGQDEFSLTPKLLLNLGLRYDYYSTVGGSTNPRLALIYHPQEGTALKFLYGSAFRAPTAYELHYRSWTLKGNPALHPETIRSTEVVFERAVTRQLRLSASAYTNSLHNLIGEELDPVDGFFIFRNRQNVLSRGVQIEANARWVNGLEATASYNLQRTTDTATHRSLINSPLHLLKLGASVPVVRNQLFASLDSWYMSRRRTLSGSSVGGFPVVNFTLFSRNFGKHADVSASLYNLFDKNYADPGAEEHTQDWLQQDGRNFRVKLTFRF